MAFDAGMLAAAIDEIRRESSGARVEKVYQPEKDEIIIQIRSLVGGRRILINAGSNNPRIGYTRASRENPQNPPMFCMLLRKHLQGAKLISVEQAGFERVAILGFETRDEMGFECKKYLIAEIMGKYSNLIFADGQPESGTMKVVSSLKLVDFSTSALRQILPGMTYELPPKQDKLNPMDVSRREFEEVYGRAAEDKPCDRFICENFLGIASSTAREIVFRATRHTDTPKKYCIYSDLEREFFAFVDTVKNRTFEPSMVYENSLPVEYCFMTLTHYTGLEVRSFESVSELLDLYFETRDRERRVHQRAGDILKLLTNAETRILKKLDLQRNELKKCEMGAEYKKYGDLITANMFALEKGMKQAVLTDYEDWHEDGSYGSCIIELDERLTPAANAQRFYKRYNKSKTAKVELAHQIELGESELEYIYTVFDALSRAENPTDLAEIRDELYRSGYASKMKISTSSKKSVAPSYAVYKTVGGYRVLCGKNNIQNEYITHTVASKGDYWFHVKNMPGSHVVMVCDGMPEPSEKDFTQAAEIAAFCSKASGANIAVDYTLAKNVKKPPRSKPGFVIYHTNWTAYVSPDPDKISAMREK
ncbi:MAG: NFACT family protein [Clostridia bacterium]|nr:NFACT family protein [Clostridia bacterium]